MSAARRAWGAAAVALALSAGAAGATPPAPGKRGACNAPPHSVSRDNLAAMRARLAAGRAASPRRAVASADTVRLLALRIDFPDLALGASPRGPGLPADELHDRFYFQNQFHYLAQYYSAASCGRMQLAVDVPDVVAHAAHPQAYYGELAGYDSLMIALTREAVRAADAAVDFATYDGVLVIHAGPGQESDVAGDSPSQIWSGFLDKRTFRETLSSKDSVVTGIRTEDGREVQSVVILPEWEVQDLTAANKTRLGSLGVYAHEVGQELGMIPLFDSTPSPVPDSQGIGNFDVMGYGLWVANGFIPPLPSTFNRVLMGWVDPIDVRRDAEVVLRDQERGPADSIVVRVPISEREYFLVSYVDEDPDGPIVKSCAGQPPDPTPRRYFDFDDKNGDCRFDFVDQNGDSVLSAGDLIDSYAGAEWDFFMTDLIGVGTTAGNGYGLLVLHVDEQVLQDVLAQHSTNVEGDPRHKAVDVEEADGIQDLDRIADNPRAFGCAADYFVRGQSFGPNTIPDSRSTDGAPTGIRIQLEALPDSLPGPIFGAHAGVGVRFEAAPQPAAPRRRAERDLPGEIGSDLVALGLGPSGSGLVVPADSGRVFLAGADLDEAPVADADPTTLRPWVTAPAAWRGTWVGSPVVGGVGYDSLPAAVLCADADSLGQRRTRVFAWRSDASEVRHLDGPSPGPGLFASLPGSARSPLLFDVDGDGWLDVVVPRQTANGVRIAEFLSRPNGAWTQREVTGDPGARPSGGPVGVRWSERGQGKVPGLAWTEVDSTTRRTSLRVAVDLGRDPRPTVLVLSTALSPGTVRLACADLDGDGTDELVVAGSDGTVSILRLDPPGMASAWRVASRLAATTLSPLALADVDGDGTLEILVASESEMHVLSLTGAEMTGWPYALRLEPGLEREIDPGRGAGSPLAADLDGDGKMELALHLPGGAFLVWDAGGKRRRDLEAALPARAEATPLVADLDGDGIAELAALGRFARLRAGPDSLLATPRTQIVTWSLPEAGPIAWGELGGDGRHAFHDSRARTVRISANDPKLASFAVGPNPASESVQARVRLTAPARVRCRLFDLEGQAVRDASQEGVPGSIVEFWFDLRGLASGVYLAHVELSTGGQSTRLLAVRH